jgi:outer membrane autotransporter protein
MGTETVTENVTDGIIATGDSDDVLTIGSGVTVTNVEDEFGTGVTINSPGYSVVNEGAIGEFVEGVGVQFTGAGSELTNDGAITGFIAGAFFADEGTVVNSGDILGGFVGVDFANGGTVENQTDATIDAPNDSAVWIEPTEKAGIVTNLGTISSDSAASPTIDIASSTRSELDNQGTITGVFDAVVIADAAVVANTGTIESTAGRGVVLEGSGTLENDATISAAAEGVLVDADASVTNRGTITSSGAAGVRLDGSGGLTNQGTISGSTDAVQATKGANVTNTGILEGGTGAAIAFTGVGDDNTFTHSGSATTSGGGAAVEMGGGDDLVILQTGATLSGDIDGGAGTDTVRLEGSGTLNQELQGVESLQVNATVWELTGIVDVDDTQIDAGRLTVSGSLSGAVDVNGGSILGGSGSLLGDVVNRGVVTPGDSIGTLSVGSYVQEAGGNLEIEISNVDADLLEVTGTADIQGGTLSLVPVGSLDLAGPFDVVTAGTLTAGQFDTTSVSPLFTSTVLYDTVAGSISVSLERTGSLAAIADTHNQRRVGETSDAMFPTATGDLALILDELVALPDERSIQGGLDQLSAEPLGATAQLAFTNARWHTTTLTEHLRNLRLGLQIATPTLAFAPSAFPAAMIASGTALPGRRESGAWQLRANAYGVYSELDGGSDYTGFDAASGVFGLGIDGWVDEHVIVGGDVSATYTHVDSDRGGTDMDALSGRLSGFGSLDFGPWYADGLASYAYHWFDADRRVRYGNIDRTADSDHGAHEVGGYLGTGLHFERGGFDFGPEASAQYLVLFEDSYDESSAGAAALDIDDRDTDSLQSRVGVRISRPWQIDRETTIAPRLRLAWAHEWLDTSHDLDATFPDSPVGGVEVRSRSLSRDSLIARVWIQALLGYDLVVEGDYGIDLGDDFMSHQLSVVLRAEF